MAVTDELPRWSVADIHKSLEARSFTDAMELLGADVGRLESLFDERGIRAVDPREVTTDDGEAADLVIESYNRALQASEVLEATVYATVSTNSRDELAQSLFSQMLDTESRLQPLLARLADWVSSLGVDQLAAVSQQVAQHGGPLTRLASRADHQMLEMEEGLYAELATNGSSAWGRLQADVTSQLMAEVSYPDGHVETLPMPAVRGLAAEPDVLVRKAAYEAEMEAWPTVSTPVAAAMNAIKGEANTVNRRRHWESPLDASLFANSVSRPTFEAMQEAVSSVLPDFRHWMRTKAKIHKDEGSLPWWNLMAPLPLAEDSISWDAGIDVVRSAFSEFSPQLGGLVDRALAESWIDAPPTDGKVGGAFCMPFVNDRSLVLLNWTGSADSVQTAAHELGHAYHNVTLAERTQLQRRLPMALAETASIFCETLVVEAGLATLEGAERLALLDVDLVGSNQVIVDIRSRVLFETEVFARRQQRTIGVGELNEMMNEAQNAAYGDGLNQETAHPYMWLLKPHYYGSHFYNWPYTYGLLFGLGLFARYKQQPDRFRSGYDNLLSRAGMDTAEQLGEAFDLDVTDIGFWQSSVEVLRKRITEYESLAKDLGLLG